MNTITPIETRYAGCRFRSRLEARWAVFFDRLGIKWEYEPQGFELWQAYGSTVKRNYLPDFYLPNEDLWVEVKGDSNAIDLDLIAMAVIPHGGGFAKNGLLLLGPIPRPDDWCFSHSLFTFHEGDVNYGVAHFYTPRMHREENLATVGNDSDYIIDPAYATFGFQGRAGVDICEDYRYLHDAYVAARSARFEHGENG